VKAADVLRDRYGAPFIEVELEAAKAGAKTAPAPSA